MFLIIERLYAHPVVYFAVSCLLVGAEQIIESECICMCPLQLQRYRHDSDVGLTERQRRDGSTASKLNGHISNTDRSDGSFIRLQVNTIIMQHTLNTKRGRDSTYTKPNI
jgi:hypothetical protein